MLWAFYVFPFGSWHGSLVSAASAEQERSSVPWLWCVHCCSTQLLPGLLTSARSALGHLWQLCCSSYQCYFRQWFPTVSLGWYHRCFSATQRANALSLGCSGKGHIIFPELSDLSVQLLSTYSLPCCLVLISHPLFQFVVERVYEGKNADSHLQSYSHCSELVQINLQLLLTLIPISPQNLHSFPLFSQLWNHQIIQQISNCYCYLASFVCLLLPVFSSPKMFSIYTQNYLLKTPSIITLFSYLKLLNPILSESNSHSPGPVQWSSG